MPSFGGKQLIVKNKLHRGQKHCQNNNMEHICRLTEIVNNWSNYHTVNYPLEKVMLTVATLTAKASEAETIES